MSLLALKLFLNLFVHTVEFPLPLVVMLNYKKHRRNKTRYQNGPSNVVLSWMGEKFGYLSVFVALDEVITLLLLF